MRRTLLVVLTVFMTVGAYSQGKQYDDYTRWQISLDGGWSYRLGKTISPTPDMRDYIKGLRSGYNIAGNGLFYFNKSIGAGIDFSVSKYSNEDQHLNLGNAIVNESDNITITYIAPCAGYRIMVGEEKDHTFLFNLSIGALLYKDKGYVDFQQVDINGSTVGIRIGAGYSYSITKNIAVGANMSLLTGSLSSYTVQMNGGQKQKIDLEDENRENLSQFNLTAGIRFNF